jgi:segregation and condensation protein B
MELKFILEAILFSAQKPLSLKEIRDVFTGAPEHAEGDETVRGLKKVKEEALTAALEELAREHEAAGRSFRLVCVAGSWQFVTQPDYAPWLKALVGHKTRAPRLSQPALETLAIIAYRQPITRAEIEQVRGVTVDGVMQTLLERGLVEHTGRAEVVGRPMTYGTTAVFLEYFGLRSLEGLPAADELRRIVVQKPEALVTAEPGLATVPPEQLDLPGKAEGQSPETEVQSPETEAQSPKSEVQSPEAETESSEAEAQSPKPKVRRPKSKAHSPEAEVKGPEGEAEGGGQETGEEAEKAEPATDEDEETQGEP